MAGKKTMQIRLSPVLMRIAERAAPRSGPFCSGDSCFMTDKSESDRGQTIIEFAFIIVLLFILILGIMEFGMVLYNKSILTDACREGARAGVVFRADSSTFAYDPLTEAEIRAVIDGYVQKRLVTFGEPFDAATDVVVAWDPYPPIHGGELDVRVNFAYTFLALPYLGNMGSDTMNLSARTVMRME
jgi:hypothetical protein